ncbi:uncharacterized protein LOC141883939 isoform X2 [Acropora palmata]|uniref:uncharacterized protein LOC141883939 isoform X2 n=1 Tax=Acropora palmata TaxID=6131 RepID=UPI003D9FFB2B
MRSAKDLPQCALVFFFYGSSLLFFGCDAVKATYACEGKTMRLECDTYSVIQIYMAKYGRLEPGSSICPSVNISTLTCRADRVLLKIATKCANRRICVIRANVATFGDPCPGTFKYLDVIYGCAPRPIPTYTTEVLSTMDTTQTTSSTERLTRTKTVTRRTSTSEKYEKNMTSNVTAITTVIGNIVLKTTIRSGETTTTEAISKALQVPEAKTSGSGDSPRHTLVAFLSSVAGATGGLIVFLIITHICKQHRRKRKFTAKRRKSEKGDERNKLKSVTIEIQGSDDETKEINVSPGDIIIIDNNDPNQSESEDLGYLSEIVRFYNSQNGIGSDDQMSIRKQFSTCDTPSVISTSESRDSKYDSSGTSNKRCTCQQGVLISPSSPPVVT